VPARVERRCDGPLQLDLGRIVIPHRVEDVPPPPAFIYTPFVSSRATEASGPSPGLLERACSAGKAHPLRWRVQRAGRAGLAPPVPAEPARELQAASA
jgi:hypothetical protein